jgi:hypothetical protein
LLPHAGAESIAGTEISFEMARVTRPMIIAGVVICSVAVVLLSSVAVLYWKYPDFRDEAFPLVLFFDLVFAYRLYRYLKMLRKNAQKYEVQPLS